MTDPAIVEAAGRLTPNVKARIDALDRVGLCKHWRFAASGDPLLSGEAGDYFQARLKAVGGFTPEISKQIGWGQ